MKNKLREIIKRTKRMVFALRLKRFMNGELTNQENEWYEFCKQYLKQQQLKLKRGEE